MQIKKYDLDIDGKKIEFEFSDLVSSADASVTVSCGDTKVLVVAVMGGKTDKDYLPLRVDYLERYYATGQILGGKYKKREGKPSTEATLTARVIDRSIRPFFDKHLNNDVQITAMVLSLGDYDPDVLAVCGTSMALSVSSIPWNGPISAVRVAENKNGDIQVNPTYTFRKDNNYYETVISSLSDNKVAMIETEASEVSEENFLKAIDVAVKNNSKIIQLIQKVQKEIGKEKVAIYKEKPTDVLDSLYQESIKNVVENNFSLILDRQASSMIKNEFSKYVQEHSEYKYQTTVLDQFIDKKFKEVVRKKITEEKQRLDGRGIDEVRPLYAKAKRLTKKLDGSAIFYRGQTHVLSVLTLGDLKDALFIDEMEIQTEKNYMHYYNFPSFSVGETGFYRSPGRREIGHGALAEKAVRRMLPSVENFPYTMRVVSEVMSSNGSTSMAATTASSMALLSGGVPLKNSVTGVAIGLVYENANDYTLLTDILGTEDFYGDMDFKVAGTKDGITAIQLDIKIAGITKDIITKTLQKAKIARKYILKTIDAEISEPAEMSDSVERIKKMQIPKDMIGYIIGKAGVSIKAIIKKSGAKIDIKRDGQTFIVGSDLSTDNAIEIIREKIEEAEAREFRRAEARKKSTEDRVKREGSVEKGERSKD